MFYKKRGFTLIELLVTISIISVLTAIGLANFAVSQKRARDARRQADLESVRSALEIFRAQNSVYPATPGSCGARPGTAPLILDATYINTYPTDPVSGNNYCYVQTGGGSGYQLCAFLENGAASGSSCGGATCKGGSGCNYQVVNP